MRLLTEFIKIWAFAARGGIMNRRNFFAVFEMFFWPLVAVFSVGLLTQFLQLDEATVSFVLIGALAMNTMQIVQLDISYALLYDVWSKSLKHGFIAPIRLGHIVLGSGLVGFVRGLLVFAIMGALSIWYFNMELWRPGLLPLLFFLVGLFLMAAIAGVLVIGLVLIFGHRAEITAWAITYLLMILCGLYYPVSLLPTGVRGLAELIPLTYFLEYFRSFYGFPASVAHPLEWGLLLGLVYLVVSYGLMLLSLKASLRQGTLVKLSE
ncbi:MAG: ABC transporter permease [Deltaproteobacteria bacterium]|nr:ABC transporter permease [Deltaproteobacteria bacterium]MBW1951995.1 ABC transporter permease [Deltaproteobacteria bacterium]MBW1987220.1 ABC transporter permease [Deltaproteobacteria bacterium]MBW2134299.1 ABC transporter permease [Deltaproteobacteria bacterium]